MNEYCPNCGERINKDRTDDYNPFDLKSVKEYNTYLKEKKYKEKLNSIYGMPKEKLNERNDKNE